MPNHDYSGRIITRRQCTPLQLNTRRHPTPRLFRTLLDCNSDRYTPVLVAASLHNVPNALRSAPRIHINSDRRHTPHISPPFHSKPQHCHPFLDAAPIQTVPRLHRNSLHGQPGHNNTRRHSRSALLMAFLAFTANHYNPGRFLPPLLTTSSHFESILAVRTRPPHNNS